jgi:hypothetical protein
MVVGGYRDLFSAIAGSGGALTGLLFVALSVSVPRPRPNAATPLVRQIRAAAALLCFVNALAVSLYGLVPGGNIGYPALAVGIIGIVFTAAAIRSIVASRTSRRQQFGQVGLFVLLLLIFGTGVVSGGAVIGNAGNAAQVQLIGYALVSSLLVGISRAWELVGDRDTGLLASLESLLRPASHAGIYQSDGADVPVSDERGDGPPPAQRDDGPPPAQRDDGPPPAQPDNSAD